MAPVVVASDLSAHAAEALQYALRFRPAPIHLFHVHTGSTPEAYGISRAESSRAAGDGTTRDLVEAALLRAADGAEGVVVAWRSELRLADAISSYAAEVGADLIVMGTHGHTGVRRLMLGSVTEAVAQAAPSDVLAVPRRTTVPWSEMPTSRVLCAVDLSEGSQAVADRAATVAGRLAADAPRLLHVEDGSAIATVRELASGPVTLEAIEREHGVVTNRHGRIEAVAGRAAPTIVRQADALDADLVVVGSHRRTGASRVLGSVAARVLRTARRPVLVVRPLA